MSSTTTPKSIGLIIGTTRTPRVSPSVAAFVEKVLTAKLGDGYTLTVIDLENWNLPFFNEPIIPAGLPADDPTPGYTKPLTRAWSAEIRKHDAFIFLTAQYNWGVPAPLKNAIDFLFHEWKGKPGLVVSYGGHGGGKAAAALLTTLQGLRMRLVSLQPAITLGPSQPSAIKEGKLLDGQEDIWDKEGVPGRLEAAFAELIKLLEEPAPVAEKK